MKYFIRGIGKGVVTFVMLPLFLIAGAAVGFLGWLEKVEDDWTQAGRP